MGKLTKNQKLAAGLQAKLKQGNRTLSRKLHSW